MRIEVTDSPHNHSTSEKRKRLMQKSKSVKHQSMRKSRSHNDDLDDPETDYSPKQHSQAAFALSPNSRPPDIDTNTEHSSTHKSSLLSPTPTPQFCFFCIIYTFFDYFFFMCRNLIIHGL